MPRWFALALPVFSLFAPSAFADRSCAYHVAVSASLLDAPLIGLSKAEIKKRLGNKVVFVFGPPGGGKGSALEILVREYGFVHSSFGNVLRQEVRKKTPVGVLAAEYMNRGEMVPGEITEGLLESTLRDLPHDNLGFCDGFPRETVQRVVMERSLGEKHFDYRDAILIDANVDQSISRLSGRLTCVPCNRTYHVSAPGRTPKVPGHCDQCGLPLTVRKDDNEASIRVRYETYFKVTGPVIDQLSDEGRMFALSGEAPSEIVAEKMLEVLLFPERFRAPLTPFGKLKLHLDDPRLVSDPAVLKALLREFKTVTRAGDGRYVYVIVDEESQANPLREFLRPHHVSVIAVPSNRKFDFAPALLERLGDQSPIAVLQELYESSDPAASMLFVREAPTPWIVSRYHGFGENRTAQSNNAFDLWWHYRF